MSTKEAKKLCQHICMVCGADYGKPCDKEYHRPKSFMYVHRWYKKEWWVNYRDTNEGWVLEKRLYLHAELGAILRQKLHHIVEGIL